MNKGEMLKNSVLQLAIEGKLVPQNENDGGVFSLIKQIKKGRNNFIKINNLKKNKSESEIFKRSESYYEKIGNKEKIIDDEILFEIPETWNWIRFSDLAHFNLGKTPYRKDPKFWDNGKYNWISIADMIDGGHITNTKEKVSEVAFKETFKKDIVPKNTLIMSFKLTLGKISILNIDAFHNEAIISIYPFYDEEFINRDFLFHILPFIAKNGDTKSAIKGKTLNKSSLSKLLIPLPPLEEQKRIVEKIEKISYLH